MNDEIDFDEWEQNNGGMDSEDRKLDFYEQLKTWVQKNAEVRRLRAEVDSEIRLLRNYASMSGIDMTSFIFPEGKFVEKERRCPITRELLFKHCDGLVSEDVLQQLCDRINAREVKKYQIFQQTRKNQMFDEEK